MRLFSGQCGGNECSSQTFAQNKFQISPFDMLPDMSVVNYNNDPSNTVTFDNIDVYSCEFTKD